jgi:hypothetical protein
MKYVKILFAACCLIGALGPDCNGQGVRMVGHSHYQVLDTTGFYLYSVNKLVQGEKIARPQTLYYFSKKRDDTVQELTRANLEQAFAANAGFRYRLEASFRSDKELIVFDKTLNMYKVKYLYQASLTGQGTF